MLHAGEVGLRRIGEEVVAAGPAHVEMLDQPVRVETHVGHLHGQICDGGAAAARKLANAVDGVVIVVGQEVMAARCEGIGLAHQLQRAAGVGRKDHGVFVRREKLKDRGARSTSRCLPAKWGCWVCQTLQSNSICPLRGVQPAAGIVEVICPVREPDCGAHVEARSQRSRASFPRAQGVHNRPGHRQVVAVSWLRGRCLLRRPSAEDRAAQIRRCFRQVYTRAGPCPTVGPGFRLLAADARNIRRGRMRQLPLAAGAAALYAAVDRVFG